MSGTGRTRAVLALPRAVVGFLGLTAVIVGILAMHVWMGGHGASAAHGVSALSGAGAAHGVSGPSGAAQPAAMATVPGTAVPGAAVVVEHAGPAAQSQHAGHDSSAPPHASSGSDASPVHGAHGCVGSCEEGAVSVGLCVLAFIVAALLAFLLPAGRLVPGSVLPRGPPLIRLRPQSTPAPSLIRLCISRT